MAKAVITALILSFCTILGIGQSLVDNAYLLRKLTDKDSSVRVPNSGVAFLQQTRLKGDHFGWLRSDDFVSEGGDLFYFEMDCQVPPGPWDEYTPGALQLVVSIPQGATQISFDSISKLRYQLINHYNGPWKTDKTQEVLSGVLTLNRRGDSVELDGTINIDTYKPRSHQEIVFAHFRTVALSLPDYVSKEKADELERQRLSSRMWEAERIESEERSRFYDSLFNHKKFPNNNLTAKPERGKKFNFNLCGSYILDGARVTDTIKNNLTELLVGNILKTDYGDKKVITLHALYDPIRRAIDDETNYSLTLEVDTLIPRMRYRIDAEGKEVVAKLGYWHYGPGGQAITTQDCEGYLLIDEVRSDRVRGQLNLSFDTGEDGIFSLKGNFELPLVKLSAFLGLEYRIQFKQMKFWQEE